MESSCEGSSSSSKTELQPRSSAVYFSQHHACHSVDGDHAKREGR